MNDRVVITGLGVVSSIGTGKDEFWRNVLSGTSGIGPVSVFDTKDHFTHNGGEISNFDPSDHFEEQEYRLMNRSSQMALVAAKLAVSDAGLSERSLDNSNAGVSCGTTLGDAQSIELIDNSLLDNTDINKDHCYQIPTHSTPSNIASELKLNGPSFMFSTACAAGNYAVSYAYDLIRLGRADIMIAGASDPMSRIEFTGFNQFSAVAPDKCRPFDKGRKGMMLAEGAGFLVLETLDRALNRKAHIYGELIGYGLSCDAAHMTNPSVEGVAQCMINAMKDAGIRTDDVDYISAHGTGTSANDRTEVAAIKKVFGDRYRSIPVSSIKSMLGHTMGAASAIEAVTCALIINNDKIPPTINYENVDPECDIDCVPNIARDHVVNIALNNSYAFGGNNASVVFRKYTG